MYNIFIWSDNEKVEQALEYIFDVGRSTIRKTLPSYQPRDVGVFKLFTATSAYLREEAYPPYEMRVAMKQDLQPALKAYEKLARFTSKNIIGEGQVVKTSIDGENIVQIAKQYSSVMSKKVQYNFKNIMPGTTKLYKHVKNPSSITINADDLKHFISKVKKHLFPKIDGELLYIDGAYEDGSGERRAITTMGVTFAGHVDGKVDEFSNTGNLIYDTVLQSEIIIAAFFDGEYKSGKSALAFPENINWYKIIKGGKTGGASLCKMGAALKIKSKKGIAVLSDDPSQIVIETSPSHDLTSTLAKTIAEYDEDFSDGPDDMEIKMQCESDLFASVLSTIAGKGARIGFPRSGEGLVLFSDNVTSACIVSKSEVPVKITQKEKEVLPPPEEPEKKSAASAELEINEAASYENLGVDEITSYEDLGDSYLLKIEDKSTAIISKDMVKEMAGKVMAEATTLIDQVLAAVSRANGRAIDRVEVMEYIPGANLSSIGAALSTLYRRGQIERISKGMYRIPD